MDIDQSCEESCISFTKFPEEKSKVVKELYMTVFLVVTQNTGLVRILTDKKNEKVLQDMIIFDLRRILIKNLAS